MSDSATARTGRIICLEGPSAVGKTTLAQALAREFGGAVVPEIEAAAAPPVAESAAWFVERHVEQWRRAQGLSSQAPFVTLDGDPFKGLWYNWIFPEPGWPGAEIVGPLYRSRIEQEVLAFPALYVILTATEDRLRERRDGDATRRRRSFEQHLKMIEPQRRYFAALQAAAPARVAFLKTDESSALAAQVVELVARLPACSPDSLHLLDEMLEWLRRNSPAASAHK